ncbi:MAG: AAA family ATPase [Fimbriiglobus sp.]
MIPLRIRMTGFLSYHHPQEIDFASAPIWMLSGSNGSGKSAIFDALTYALFGSHRGGNQNAIELINKDSQTAIVEFDFRLDQNAYRVKRTLKRTTKGTSTGTQQLFQEMPDASWEAVPDTSKKVDFDHWIQEKIGLNYDTFTSSVLLLQGKAEKLLDAKPNGRAEVLASIVDLGRYQKLQEVANQRKIDFKNRLEALSYQTSAIPDVSDMEFYAAELDIEAKEADRKQTQSSIDQLTTLEAQCQRWLEAQSRVTAAQARLDQAEKLLADAVSIEVAMRRLSELQAVMPAVNVVVTTRANLRLSNDKTKRFTDQRAEQQEAKRQSERAWEQARSDRALAQKDLESEETQLAELITRLRDLSGLLEKVRVLTDQQTALAGLQTELKRLPTDPAAAYQEAQKQLDRLIELQRISPFLERFALDRSHLQTALKDQVASTESLATLGDTGKALKASSDANTAKLTEARAAKTRLEEAATIARTMLSQAQASLAEFSTMAGEKSCRACGQALTRKHFAEEKAKREAELAEATTKLQDAEKALKKAVSEETKLAKIAEEFQTKLNDLREKYATEKNESKKHAEAIARLQGALSLDQAELPEAYKKRIGSTDWVTTTYPARDELAAMKQEITLLPGSRAAVTKAQEALTKHGQLKSKIETTNSTIAGLMEGTAKLDGVKLLAENQKLQASEATLQSQIKAHKLTLKKLEEDIDRYRVASHSADQTLADLTGKLNTEEVQRKNCEDNIARATAQLPEAWKKLVEKAGMGEAGTWKSELDQLELEGIPAKHQSLEQARAGLGALREALRVQVTELDAFPTEARQAPEGVRSQIEAARTELGEREQAHLAALQQKAKLEGYREQRAAISQEYLTLDAKFHQYKALSELLGRDRLQRHLVRQAERQIVEYANAVLDRLSAGQLFLRTVGSEEGTSTEKALELEAFNRTTGSAPINVAFLSGSQKFRVAVALALAIGQYASRLHRPIESVIIDEGFGCLDRQGRQVMIQELQNLRGHLHCILLVSHQEEFAEAFPNGYRFELQDGSTKVTRLER